MMMGISSVLIYLFGSHLILREYSSARAVPTKYKSTSLPSAKASLPEQIAVGIERPKPFVHA